MELDFAEERRRGGAAVRFDIVLDLEFVTDFDVRVDFRFCPCQADIGGGLFPFKFFIVVFDDGDGLVDADGFRLRVDLGIVRKLRVDQPFCCLDEGGFDRFFHVVGREPLFVGDRFDNV